MTDLRQKNVFMGYQIKELESLKAENERLREALKSVRNEIASQAPQIIWHSEIETTFDYITGALGDKMTWDEWAALKQEEG